MRIMTLQEATDQGSTSSELRTLANCLDRISKSKDDEVNFDPKINRRNAVNLRYLAKELQKVGR